MDIKLPTIPIRKPTTRHMPAIGHRTCVKGTMVRKSREPVFWMAPRIAS